MKRIGLSVGFFTAGLLTTWVAMAAGSHMPPWLKVHLTHHSSGCYEIGPCSLPWWAAVLMVIYVFGPSIVFLVTGWISAKPGVSTTKRLSWLLILIVVTALFYLAGYVVGDKKMAAS